MPQMPGERGLFLYSSTGKFPTNAGKRSLPHTALQANPSQLQSRGSRETFIPAAVLPRTDLTIFNAFSLIDNNCFIYLPLSSRNNSLLNIYNNFNNMIHSNFKMNGEANYTAPTCETVELDTNATICYGSEGTFGINPWEDENLGLDF